MVRRTLVALTLAFILVSLSFASLPGRRAQASTATIIKDTDVYIYVPSTVPQDQPAQILVTVHGMGGDGPTFCQNLLATAERNGWIIVSPTFKYQDYKNPDLVLQDDTTFIPRLLGMIDSVPLRTGIMTRQKVLLYGHSRGAQAVHRFATYYPQRTLGVAAVSAGSYTLPLETMMVNGKSQTLPMPYGVANMRQYLGTNFDFDAFKQIPFRIVVGGQDNNPDDTPRAWDPYVGVTRVDRARSYTRILQNLGMQADLAVYPDADHGVSAPMLNESMAFLENVVAGKARSYGFGPVRGALYYGSVANVAMQHR